MFAKLLKNEFKATYKMMLLFSGLLLLTALLAALVVRFLNITGMTETNAVFPLKEVIGSLLLMAAMFALIVYVTGSFIFLVVRYYKSRFTDEGYLTFTLPATSRQIFLSSYVSILIWNLIIGVVVILSFLIVIILGTMGTEIWNGSADTDGLGSGLSTVYWILQLATIIVSFLGSIMLTLTSVTIGAVIAKKHKVLAAVGVYYGANMLVGVVTGIISAVVLFAESFTDTDTILTYTYVPQLLIYTIILIGGYVINIHLMGKKLNLP